MSEQHEYRVYALDGLLKILTAEWLDADSDEEAIAIVEATCPGKLCELWNGDRLVARVEADRLSA